jgi:hypothetical protein
MTHDTSQEVAQQMATKQREDEERARAEMQGLTPEAETQEGSSYSESTVAELKDELAERDLPKSGKKEDLVARLEEDDQKGSDQPAQEEGRS